VLLETGRVRRCSVLCRARARGATRGSHGIGGVCQAVFRGALVVLELRRRRRESLQLTDTGTGFADGPGADSHFENGSLILRLQIARV
jgi:hypothetical protein